MNPNRHAYQTNKSVLTITSETPEKEVLKRFVSDYLHTDLSDHIPVLTTMCRYEIHFIAYASERFRALYGMNAGLRTITRILLLSDDKMGKYLVCDV